MPWLRLGDTAAMHPRLLGVVEYVDFDERLLNETFGFLVRCATQAAGFITDYVVDFGTATVIAGPSRVRDLLGVCEFAGLMQPIDIEGRRQWKIMEDPEFIHMRLQEELEWEKQRKADNGDPALTIQIRLRDGDACRYCGSVVKWTARKGKIAGTYDHRVPGEAGTLETMVVACGSCNAKRGNDPTADRILPPYPVPEEPYYSDSTIEWINSHPWAQQHGITLVTKRSKDIPPGQVAPCHAKHVAQPALYQVELREPDIDPRADEATDRGTPPHPAARAPRVAPEDTALSPSPETVARGVGQSSDTVRGTAQSPAAASARVSQSECDLALTSEVVSDRFDPSPETVARGLADAYSSAARGSGLRALDEGHDEPLHKISPRPAETMDLPDPADNLPNKSDPADHQCARSGFSGSGRDGSGRAGTADGEGRKRKGSWTIRSRRKKR
ncbi:hypothetical protein CKALI_11370 [Corynebacterium kalinowskii]|uniref:HNH nuclease domain-containing protein n=1 Tax=Corynebacterium kalinowskii TaxID=2675216 RepID=A0A6B8W7Q2_9CORY|nr:HNH endonuclease [Corynebacterium kalinowskii]QGU03118.1 hypothetical protein CKALI_11370 [Corynebacterium kalinowskii]